jgi:hypothetical protein
LYDGFSDFGLGSSNYAYSGYTLIGPNDGYWIVTGNTITNGGNMIMSTGYNNDIIFAQGGTNKANEVARFKFNQGLVLKSNGVTFADGTYQNTAAAPFVYSNAAFLQANSAYAYANSLSTGGVSSANTAGTANVALAVNVTNQSTGTYYLKLANTNSGVANTSANTLLTFNVATGNLAAPYFVGNGSFLTGIASAGSANTANGANYASQLVITNANTGSYYVKLGDQVSGTGNVYANSYLTYNAATEILSANYYSGNGIYLTGITASTAQTAQSANTANTANFANALIVTNPSSGTYFVKFGSANNGQSQVSANNGFTFNAGNDQLSVPLMTVTGAAFAPGGSLNFTGGSTSYLSVPASPISTTGNFTVEGWVYPTTTADEGIFFLYGNTGSYAGLRFGHVSGGFYILHSTNGSSWAVNSGNIGPTALNTWYHVAIVRNGTAGTIYINGTSVYTFTFGTLYAGSVNLIGAQYYTASALNYFTGNITNIRVTNGTAVYTSNFTPQTSPLWVVANTSLLMDVSTSGAYLTDSSVNNYTITNQGAVTYSATTPFTTGAASSVSTNTGALIVVGGIGVSDNIYVANNIVVTGNVTGAYLYGNGSFLTGVAASTAGSANTANVANVAAALTVTNPSSGSYFVKFGSANIGQSQISANSNFTFNAGTDTLYVPTANITGSTFNSGGSLYFNGASNRLTTATSSLYDLSNTNFTIELWVYLTAYPSSAANRLISTGVNNVQSTVDIQISTTGGLTAGVAYSTGGNIASSTTIPLNTWTHVALTVSSNTGTLWQNGANVGYSTGWSISGGGGSNYFYVGYDTTATVNAPFTGYLTNVRLVKGTAVYNAPFTVPSSPLQNVANTQVLLDVLSSGTYLTDSSNNNTTFSTTGAVTYSSNTPYFSTGSASISPTTGALVVVGGHGVSGNIYAGNNIVSGGNVTIGGAVLFSSAAFSAAGTTQNTATLITVDNAYVTGGTGGVILPVAAVGREISITNNTGAAIIVYPAIGASLEQQASNLGVSVPSYATIELVAKSTTNWWSTTYVYQAGTDINITQSGNSTIVISDTSTLATVTGRGNTTNTALTVNNNITVTGNANAAYFYGNGSFLTGITSAGSANTANSANYASQLTITNASSGNYYVKLGDQVSGTANVFANSAFTFNAATDTMTVPQMSVNGSTFVPPGGSMYIAAGNYLTVNAVAIASSAKLTMTGPYTVETWIYSTLTNNNPSFAIYGQYQNTGVPGYENTSPEQFFGVGNTGSVFSMFFSGIEPGFGQQTIYGTANTFITPNTWNHVAFTRDSANNLGFFFNGVQQPIATTGNAFGFSNTTPITFGTGPLAGSYSNVYINGATNAFNGYLTNFRVVNGTAAYAPGSNFTPPTSPLANIANTVLLLSANNALSPYIDSSVSNIAFANVGSNTITWSNTTPFPMAAMNISNGMIVSGNVIFTGNTYSSGNVYALHYFGDGSLLSGVQAASANSASIAQQITVLQANTNYNYYVKLGDQAIGASNTYSNTYLTFNGATDTLTSPMISVLGNTIAAPGGSLYFPSGNYATVNANAYQVAGAKLNLTGPYTLETWIYSSLPPANNYPNFTIFGQYQNSGVSGYENGGPEWNFAMANNGSAYSMCIYGLEPGFGQETMYGTANTFITPNTWYHVAFTRDSANNLGFFFNGVQQPITTSGTNYGMSNSTSLNFGTGIVSNVYINGASATFNGYMTNLRIVNGTAVYPPGTNFTPPTTPLLNIANTALLLSAASNNQYFSDTSSNQIKFTSVGTGPISWSANTPFPASTPRDSTNTTTGSLVVTGGLGVSSNVTAANVYATNIVGTNIIAGNLSVTTITSNGVYYSANTPPIATNILTLNALTGAVFNVSVSSAISTINITNVPAAPAIGSYVLVFNYTGTAYSVTWPASFRWPGGVAPTLTNTNGKRDMFTLMTMDGGISYQATVSGLNM